MKIFTFFSLVLFLAALPMYAADYSFDVELDGNGYYNDGSDLGATVTITEGRLNIDAKVKVFSNGKVHFDGTVTAGQNFPIGTRTNFLNLEIADGVPNSTVKVTVVWKFAKAVEVFNVVMDTGKKGHAKYSSSINGGAIQIDSFMPSHNGNLKIKLDGQCAFSEEVRCGETYFLNASAGQSIEVIAKDVAKNKKMNIAMNISMAEPALIIGAQEQEDEDMTRILGEGEFYSVKFDKKTDENGCVTTDPYALNPQGVNPQIRILVVDQKFTDVLVTINGIKFRPEFALTLNGRHFYRVGFGLKSGSEVNLALVAEGGKPQILTNFALVCENTEE